jgi:hypothetical protein
VIRRTINLGKLAKEVSAAYDKFWLNDQICGFDKKGKRIGTGVPRPPAPSYDIHADIFGKSSRVGKSKVLGEKPKKS